MKIILYLYSLLVFISCNYSNKERKAGSSLNLNTDTIDYKKKLAERANSLFDKDEFSEAIIAYDSLILIDSLKAGYFFKRGYSKSMLLDKSGAIFDYKKSIALNYSQKESSFQNIGVLYSVQAKYDSALFYLNECLKLNPTNKIASDLRTENLNSLNKK